MLVQTDQVGIAIEVQLAEFDRLTMKLRAFALAVTRVHEGQSSIIITTIHFIDLAVLADKVSSAMAKIRGPEHCETVSETPSILELEDVISDNLAYVDIIKVNEPSFWYQ